MPESPAIDLRHVARGLGLPVPQIQAVVELLDEGNTVPFITRYRKDQTGGLDEEQIRQVQDRLAKMRMLAERKQTILRSIESQDKLSEELAKLIQSAGTTKRLEDLYLPYRPKKQTLATLARSRGLEELAQEILDAADTAADLDARAADFVSTDRGVPTAAEAPLGAGHILAEQFSERAELRQKLREILQRTGKLVSQQIAPEPKAPEPKAPEPKAPEPKAPEPKAPEPKAPEPKAPEPKSPEPKAAEAKTEEAKPAEAEEEAVVESPPLEETPTEEAATPAETPAAETPAAETPVAETPAAEVSAEEVEVTEPKPAVDESAKQTEPASEADGETPAPAAERAASRSPTEEKAEDGAAAEKAEVEKAEDEKPEKKSATKADAKAAAKPQAAPRVKKLTKAQQRKKQAQEKKIKAFRDYFDYSEELRKIPPHRILAINRGERAKIIRVKIEFDMEAVTRAAEEMLIAAEHAHAEFLRGCMRDSLTRLIVPSLERELRRELTDRAELHAVSVFARNLRNLLLQPPVSDHRVLAVDPGFKSGCKLAALDQFGNVLDHAVIYLIGRSQRKQQAKQTVIDLVDRFKLTAVAIGNGTACRESEDFFAKLIEEELAERGVSYVIVNEAGASVYSTSQLGREDFPNYDATLRGAISIGRRLQDPLSELVKIDPASIGVGMYQHDVKAKHLRASLDKVVESCVNYVGVDINTASPALLRYVSGLNQLTARRVYEHRLQNGPFKNRRQLLEVPGFGEATFVQAAGFLKISGGDQPLDSTWIHPESYTVADRVLTRIDCRLEDIGGGEQAKVLAERIRNVDIAAATEQLAVGELLLKDILAHLARPGRDPREDLPTPVFKKGILKIEDLADGMEVTGTVLNVVDFGAFVDIGMHDSGLVHVSQLADKFIRDPHEVVAVGDVVKVWVVGVDKDRRRVSLTMIQPGTKREGSRRSEKGARPERGARPEKGARPEAAATEGGKAEGGRRGDGRSAAARGERGKGEARGEGGQGTRQAGRRGDSRRGEGQRSRSKGPPRGKGRRDSRPSRTDYKPKGPPKPFVPITDEMKSGKEAMRTFGDLAQFFNVGDESEKQKGHKPDGKKKKKNRKSPHKPEEGKAPTSEKPVDEKPVDEKPVDEKPTIETAEEKGQEPQQEAPPVVEETSDKQQEATAVKDIAEPPQEAADKPQDQTSPDASDSDTTTDKQPPAAE